MRHFPEWILPAFWGFWMGALSPLCPPLSPAWHQGCCFQGALLAIRASSPGSCPAVVPRPVLGRCSGNVSTYQGLGWLSLPDHFPSPGPWQVPELCPQGLRNLLPYSGPVPGEVSGCGSLVSPRLTHPACLAAQPLGWCAVGQGMCCGLVQSPQPQKGAMEADTPSGRPTCSVLLRTLWPGPGSWHPGRSLALWAACLAGLVHLS